MKRENDIAEGRIENLKCKKIRPLDVMDDDQVGPSEINEDELNGAHVQNGRKDSVPVDKNGGNSFEDVSLDSLDSPNLGDLQESGMWDMDSDFDLTFGLDLNAPVYRDQSQDVGVENNYLEHTQGCLINTNIIDISSDDGVNEAEVIEKGVETSSRSLATTWVENLSLGLAITGVNVDFGESSLVAGGKRRYTREEKAKGPATDSWLSLGDLNPQFYSVDSIKPVQPSEIDVFGLIAVRYASADSTERSKIAAKLASTLKEKYGSLGAIAKQLETLASWPESAEVKARIEAERVAALEERYQSSREIAKQYARADYHDWKNENDSSNVKQPGSASSAIQQLGNSAGPFSDALKVVRERTSKKPAEDLIEWKPSEENQGQQGNATAIFVPSLLNLSLKALAENADGIVSLQFIPDNLKRRLANILCDMRKMNVRIVELLLEQCPNQIHLKDSSWLTNDQFQQIFWNTQTKDLKVLQLDLCGQCMLDIAFLTKSLQSSTSFSSLTILSLRGACRLTDTGLKHLISSAPHLCSVNLGLCVLLTSDSINFIADSLGSILKELFIDDCHRIDAMLILPAFKKFKQLEVLSVATMSTVTDNFVGKLVEACGQNIKELDLANCCALNDCSVKAIASHCPDLCSLDISKLNNVTDIGLEHLANGCRSIQKLKLCRNGFSDEAVAAFLESSGKSLLELSLNGITEVGPNTAYAIAKCSRGLISLDISWCRRISSEALGLIVDSCSSMKLLKVFGCRQITKLFLTGHANWNVRIIGLTMTPLLDHISLLEPEELYLHYSDLPTY